jgi:uncharacterized protein involved in exopolysaccharide biosynthesis
MSRTHPELTTYASFVRRHVVLLAVCALLGLVTGVGWNAASARSYTATAAVLLTGVPGYVDVETGGRPPREVTIDTDAHLARSIAVVAAVARRTGMTRQQVVARLHVSAPELTEVLHLSFTAADPDTARAGAAAAGRALVSARRDVLGALQTDQIARLQLALAERRAELTALGSSQGSDAREEALQLQVATLRQRLKELYAARLVPAEVLQRPVRPRQADPSEPEVALTSGLLTGLCVGLAVAAWRDRAQRRRLERSASTSSPNRRAASVPTSGSSAPA